MLTILRNPGLYKNPSFSKTGLWVSTPTLAALRTLGLAQESFLFILGLLSKALILTPCGACSERETAPPLLNIANETTTLKDYWFLCVIPSEYNKRQTEDLQCCKVAFIIHNNARACKRFNDIHYLSICCLDYELFKQYGVFSHV